MKYVSNLDFLNFSNQALSEEWTIYFGQKKGFLQSKVLKYLRYLNKVITNDGI